MKKSICCIALALVMALDRAMKNQNGGDSVYDDRGLLLL